MIADEKIVSELLLKYITERHHCEIRAYNELKFADDTERDVVEIFEEYQPILEAVYLNYLTKKERQSTLAYDRIGSDPYYDPQCEMIESFEREHDSKIIVQTKVLRNNSVQLNKYVFLLEAEKWKLDNKKTFWSSRNEWEITIL